MGISVFHIDRQHGSVAADAHNAHTQAVQRLIQIFLDLTELGIGVLRTNRTQTGRFFCQICGNRTLERASRSMSIWVINTLSAKPMKLFSLIE